MNRILVIDDNEDMQMLYSEAISEEGYEVLTIGDEPHLMEYITKICPDLVVLDIRLGKYDGLDLLQEIRNTYDTLPVLICTAYPTFRYDLKSVAAVYYVDKSSNLGELKDKIRMALKGGGHAPSFSCSVEFNQKGLIPAE